MQDIYYVMDPLCEWCYGFADVMLAIHEEFRNHFRFHIIPGGLRRFNTPMNEPQVYLQNREKNSRIEAVTGVRFSRRYYESVFENHNFTLSSLPGSIAIVAMHELMPSAVFAYARDIQHALFHHGKNIHNVSLYASLAERHGVSKMVFELTYTSEDMRAKAEACFRKAHEMGAESYPTLLLARRDGYDVLMDGYAPYERVKAGLEALLNK